MKYQRILLKLSGESLGGDSKNGIDPKQLQQYAHEIHEACSAGMQMGIVIGGGNFFRGRQGEVSGFDRVQGDYMGMLATIINAMALQSELSKCGLKSKILSGIPVEKIAEPMSAQLAQHYLNEGYVLLLAGGTGNPYFTTDSAAALRAAEIKADALLKATRVDGVYTADPETNPNAQKYITLTFTEAYEKGLKIMDLTAFTLCRENNIPVIVFDVNRKGNLLKVILGEKTGTLVIP